MSYVTMQKALVGDFGVSLPKVKTTLNQALGLIEDEQLWSFQLGEGGWLTPGLLGGPSTGSISPGAITVKPFTNTVTGNAAASAAWLGLTGRPFITEMQFRVPNYSLYNIVGINAAVPTAVVLTLDRPWMEPAQTLASYMIYQCYFPAPVLNFKKFYDMRDTTNNQPMDYWSMTQLDLASEDPQRQLYDEPNYVVPYQVDARPNSATLGQMLFELWPHPLSVLPYSFHYLWRGPSLVNATDTIPYPLDEELVGHRASELLCAYKEAQKGNEVVRGSGADWKFLMGYHKAEYQKKLKTAKLLDENIVALYFTKFRRDGAMDSSDGYMTQSGQLNVGRF